MAFCHDRVRSVETFFSMLTFTSPKGKVACFDPCNALVYVPRGTPDNRTRISFTFHQTASICCQIRCLETLEIVDSIRQQKWHHIQHQRRSPKSDPSLDVLHDCPLFKSGEVDVSQLAWQRQIVWPSRSKFQYPVSSYMQSWRCGCSICWHS